jgi:hypothetical protein
MAKEKANQNPDPLANMEMEDLRPDFEPVKGFVVVPRFNKLTMKVEPATADFAGVVTEVVNYEDDRGKPRFFVTCVSLADQPHAAYWDGENKREVPIKKGDRVGVSGTGAISALKDKKGHYAVMHWTGTKKETKNGEMWEVNTKVSKAPVDTDQIPF